MSSLRTGIFNKTKNINSMSPSDEVYASICEAIQKQIDIINNLEIELTEEQFKGIIARIGRYNIQLEEYSKRFRRK